jgi:hypothetical protein
MNKDNKIASPPTASAAGELSAERTRAAQALNAAYRAHDAEVRKLRAELAAATSEVRRLRASAGAAAGGTKGGE